MSYRLFSAALLLLALGGCATTQRLPAAADPQLDSALTAAGIPPLRAGKVKIGGNVYIQSGQGNVQADNTKAGQRADAAAVGPGAAAASTRPAGPAWWVYAGLLLAGGVGGILLTRRFPILAALRLSLRR